MLCCSRNKSKQLVEALCCSHMLVSHGCVWFGMNVLFKFIVSLHKIRVWKICSIVKKLWKTNVAIRKRHCSCVGWDLLLETSWISCYVIYIATPSNWKQRRTLGSLQQSHDCYSILLDNASVRCEMFNLVCYQMLI